MFDFLIPNKKYVNLQDILKGRGRRSLYVATTLRNLHRRSEDVLGIISTLYARSLRAYITQWVLQQRNMNVTKTLRGLSMDVTIKIVFDFLEDHCVVAES